MLLTLIIDRQVFVNNDSLVRMEAFNKVKFSE